MSNLGFHEARHGRKDAPLLLWFQGGPGGSSLAGMLLENGPCLIDTENNTKFNPYSWTEEFNVVYVDQPAGVGFSYTDGNGPDSYPVRAEASSLDLIKFLKLFYETFPAMSSVDLHLSGESYGGRFVPLFASRILEFNEVVPDKKDHIPLRSIMVGNGYSNPRYQIPSLYDVSCYDYRGYPPHLSKSVCEKLLPLVDKCERALEGCAATRDIDICTATNKVCKDNFADVMERETTRNAFDRRMSRCDIPGNCFPEMESVVAFLNSPLVVQDQLEVPKMTNGLKTNWTLLDLDTAYRFIDAGDYHFPSTAELEYILEHYSSGVYRPVDVLYYVGVADIVCNPEGVLAVLQNLRWKGRAEFRATPWIDMAQKTASGKPGGRVKLAGRLALVEINEAGHLVPYNQPELILHVIRRWLNRLGTGGPLTETNYRFWPKEDAGESSPRMEDL